MQALKAIQPFSDNTSLTTLSRQHESDALVDRLLELMAQAQAYFPNQTLPLGTPDAYLRAWEELVAERGEERFTAALWRACRKSRFFPAPIEIEEHCDAAEEEQRSVRRREREANEARLRLEENLAAEREREEERRNPDYVPFDLAAEMRKIAAKQAARKEQVDAERQAIMETRRTEWKKVQNNVAADMRSRGIPEETIQAEIYGVKPCAPEK